MSKKPMPIGPRDAMGGREVEARPIETYELGTGTNQGTTTYTPRWKTPDPTPPGTLGMTAKDIELYKKTNPKYYRRGGLVQGKVIKTWK